jgi:hypothetical protein
MLSCQHCDVKNESVDPLLLCEKCVKRLDLLDEAVGLLKGFAVLINDDDQRATFDEAEMYRRLCVVIRKHEELP